MTMITPSYLGETIEYSSLHACRSTLEDPTDYVGYLQHCYAFACGLRPGTPKCYRSDMIGYFAADRCTGQWLAVLHDGEIPHVECNRFTFSNFNGLKTFKFEAVSTAEDVMKALWRRFAEVAVDRER